jgi:hypothetical protein
MQRRPWCYGCLAALLTALLLAEAGGCVGLLETVAILTVGDDQAAEFPGLKGKKVVVVCRPLAELHYRDATAAKSLATQVSVLLKKQVPKITVIDQQKVAEWTDENSWEEYPEVGKALGADMVVAIDLTSFSTYQGPTLYQGKATASIKVFDLKDDNKVVFEKDMPQVLYPPNVGKPIADEPENEFCRDFTTVVAYRIARHFFSYDPQKDMAMDAEAGLN